MNWRKSNAELTALHARVPWLYFVEWRERLDRCIQHLDGAASDRRQPEPDEAREEARRLRSSAEYLMHIADKLDAAAKKTERVRALRDTSGRTPAEAAAYLAKADELEAASA